MTDSEDYGPWANLGPAIEHVVAQLQSVPDAWEAFKAGRVAVLIDGTGFTILGPPETVTLPPPLSTFTEFDPENPPSSPYFTTWS